jgi:hypothetical protein
VDAEYWAKFGPPVAPLFVGKVDICDDHVGGMGVVDCASACGCGGADIVAAPPIAFGVPLPALGWPFGGFGASILL